MAVISFTILGVVLGLLARFLVPRGRNGGVLATLLIAVAGAVIGGVLGAAGFRESMNNMVSLPSLGMALLIGCIAVGSGWLRNGGPTRIRDLFDRGVHRGRAECA